MSDLKVTNILSYSQLTKYMFCPTSWRYHYLDKIRQNTQHAALLFGSAVGKAVEQLLITKDMTKAQNEFYSNWNEAEVNGKKQKLSDNIEIVYANSDFDADLVSEQDWKFLADIFEVENAKEHINKIYTDKDRVGFINLSDKFKRDLNMANWYSLRTKGITMLDTFNKRIMPNIEHVYGTEIPAELENPDGDKITGFADFVVKYKNFDKPIVFDLKTSARDYERDSVVTSPQLSLYLHALSDKYDNTRLAGYIVLKKNVFKNKTKHCKTCGYDGSGKTHRSCPNEIGSLRCGGEWKITIDPWIDIQVLIDSIPSRTEDIVMTNFDLINQSIKNGVFHRNFANCVDPKRGKCAYYNLCYHNKMDGLFVKNPNDKA